MTVRTLTATQRRTNTYAVPGKGEAAKASYLSSSVEVAASESGSTIDFGNIPSNARIHGCSRLYWDDLATSGSPTLDMGAFPVNNNFATSDDDAFNDGLALSAVSTANVGIPVIKDFANFGKRAWEFVNGLTSDPGGLINVKGTIKDAPTHTTGTVTGELVYSID